MKTGMTVIGVVLAAVIAVFAYYMIDIDQTQEGALPDVDVSVEGGALPEFDADVGSIEMGQAEVEVEVPDVDVSTTTETIEVPTISIEAPEDDGVLDDDES